MSCKSALYGANTSVQTLAIGNTISFGNIIRRFGCALTLANGNVIASGSGYYDIDTNINFTAGAAGTATITLYKDGVAIPGAFSTLTVVDDGLYTVNIPAIFRNINTIPSTITAVITGVATTVTSASVAVSKL